MDAVARGRLCAVKVALDPTPSQQRLLASHAGAARFVFNCMLAEVKSTLAARAWEARLLGGPLTAQQGWSLAALRRTWNAHKDRWAPWWGEVSKEAFNHGLAALSDALDNWAKSNDGSRCGRPMGFPRFRGKRHHRRSFSYTTGAFRPNRDGLSVQLPRIGRVHTHEPLRDLVRAIDAGQVQVKRATVSFSRGRWWVSFTIERLTDITIPAEAKPHPVVGVDAGVVDLLVVATPDGGEVLRLPAPRPLRDAQQKLRRLQRKAARQTRGSNRWRTTVRRIGKVHARVANVRTDAIHKATTRIATMSEVVVVEDLNIRGMAARKPGAGKAGRGFNRAVSDAALAEVSRQLTYKTGWYGGTLVVADRWFPSSKMCSSCGVREPSMPLDVRQWTCTACGTTHDRDGNAAVNLAQLAPDVGPSSRQWGGDGKYGRGADCRTDSTPVPSAGGCETSTQHGPRSGEAGTATPQGAAA